MTIRQLVASVLFGMTMMAAVLLVLYSLHQSRQLQAEIAQHEAAKQKAEHDAGLEKRRQAFAAYLDDIPEIRWWRLSDTRPEIHIGWRMGQWGARAADDCEGITSWAAILGSRMRENQLFRAWMLDGDATSPEQFDPASDFRYFNCAHADDGRFQRWEIARPHHWRGR